MDASKPFSEAGPPLVSVIVAAYNHHDIVGRAIESALQQQTAFPFEIVVGEDCSSDGTREKVLQYEQLCPCRVRVLCNKTNLKLPANIVSMISSCDSKYIAYLDADDYWTDSGKLQKQITFLEEHPEYAACSHNVRNVLLSGEVEDPCYPGLPPLTKTMDDLLEENFVPSPSVVFRRDLLAGRIPGWYATSAPIADWPLYLVLAQYGPFMHFAEIMADYTLHPKSIWSSRGRVFQCDMEIEMFRLCLDTLPRQYRRKLKQSEGVRHERRSRAFMAAKDWKAARRAAWQAASVPHLPDSVKDKFRVMLDAWMPSLMSAVRALRGVGR